MGGSSSQVFWRQSWSLAADKNLRHALGALGASVEDLPSQAWDPRTSTIGGIRDYRLSIIGSAGPGWSSILLQLNSLIGESLAEGLSRAQAGATLFFMEFEQTTWGYALYQRGQRIDRYWSDPESVDVPPQACRGSAELVASACEVSPRAVAPYLRHRDSVAEGEKAFPSDEFCLDDHWVRVDFMRQLGISYPDPSKRLTSLSMNLQATRCYANSRNPCSRRLPNLVQQKDPGGSVGDGSPNNSLERTTGLRPVAAQLMIR